MNVLVWNALVASVVFVYRSGHGLLNHTSVGGGDGSHAYLLTNT